MVLHFDAVTPIGARTCCDLPAKSGKHSHEWLDTDVPEFAAEHAALQRGDLDQRLKRSEHLDAVAAIQSLMKRAAKGQLAVGRDGTFSARVIVRVPYLLELRPALTGRGTQSRVFRLNYAEPAARDNVLLPLVLSTKPASSDNVEQNQAIDDARARSRVWTLFKVTGGGSK